MFARGRDGQRRDRRCLQGHRHVSADIDWFAPHQANKRIIDDTAKKLGLAPEKVVLTVDRHGNTSAASIPLALSVAIADGRIKRGDLVMLEDGGYLGRGAGALVTTGPKIFPSRPVDRFGPS